MANPPTPPTGMSDAELQAAFVVLWNDAQAAMQTYMTTRCPALLQDHLQYYIENNPAVPPVDPATVVVSNGDPVVVQDQAGDPVAGSPGMIIVNGNVLLAVALTV